MIQFTCELCGGTECWQYAYPTDLRAIKRKLLRNALRAYPVNVAKFIIRVFLRLLPANKFINLRKRVFAPYKRLQTPAMLIKTIKNLDKGKKLFTKTFSRSYKDRLFGENKMVQSDQEHPNGAYLRVLLQKK